MTGIDHKGRVFVWHMQDSEFNFQYQGRKEGWRDNQESMEICNKKVGDMESKYNNENEPFTRAVQR